MKTFILRLPADIHKQLKADCAGQGITMQQFIGNLIANYLKAMR